MVGYQLELKKQSFLRKRAYNEIREMKGNIRVLARVRPPVVSESPGHRGKSGLESCLVVSDKDPSEYTVL